MAGRHRNAEMSFRIGRERSDRVLFLLHDKLNVGERAGTGYVIAHWAAMSWTDRDSPFNSRCRWRRVRGRTLGQTDSQRKDDQRGEEAFAHIARTDVFAELVIQKWLKQTSNAKRPTLNAQLLQRMDEPCPLCGLRARFPFKNER
jgi:hypothetical protein